MAMSVVYTTIDGVLVHEDRGGVERQYVGDPLGSLVGELDENQNLIYTAEYWPYGEVRTESGNKQSEWGFVGLLGYLRDLATLLYVRARHYVPHRARWVTVDPLWPNEKAYTYCQSSPIPYGDPSGRSLACIGLGICVGIGIGALLTCGGDITCILCFLAAHPFLKALLLGICSLALIGCLGVWVLNVVRGLGTRGVAAGLGTIAPALGRSSGDGVPSDLDSESNCDPWKRRHCYDVCLEGCNVHWPGSWMDCFNQCVLACITDDICSAFHPNKLT